MNIDTHRHVASDAHRHLPSAHRHGSGIFIRALALRGCLAELTDALACAHDDQLVILDITNGRAHIASPPVDGNGEPARSQIVKRPDGLWEWQVRRDFVRSIRRERRKDADRLAATLGGPRSRRRFTLALAQIGDATLVRAFDRHRRRRLRAWAARVLRVALAS